jgi:hypothetical protein
MEYKRCLLRAAVFALSLVANSGQGIASSGQDTWEWHDILQSPLIEANMAECSPTHPVHNVPDFGDGLIASYTFDMNDKVGDVKERITDLTRVSRNYNIHETPVRHWALAFRSTCRTVRRKSPSIATWSLRAWMICSVNTSPCVNRAADRS